MTDMDKMVEVPEELIEDIQYHMHSYDTANSRVSAGYHLDQLMQKVSDLSSWHSGYDSDSGTLPWQREDQ